MLGTSQTTLEPHRLFAVIITPYLTRFIPILSRVLIRGFDLNQNVKEDAPFQIDSPSDLIMDVIARATTVCFFGEVSTDVMLKNGQFTTHVFLGTRYQQRTHTGV